MPEPAKQMTAADSIRDARAFFDNGEFFRSYDLAREAFEANQGSFALAHLAVLSLANAGATDVALSKFNLFGLDASSEPEALALLARLKKDLAFSTTGHQRHTFFVESRLLYEDLYRQACMRQSPQAAYYPGINAAALATWSEDRPAARRLAAEILDILRSLNIEDNEADRYWRRATEAEAYVILDRLPEAEQVVASLGELGAGRSVQTAATERQLRRLAQALHLSQAFLGKLAPPAVIHYAGHIIAPPGKFGRFLPEEETVVRRGIDDLLARENIGSGYGSLAAGADILFAEALLARGAALHIVFPFALDDFIKYSVAPASADWIARFHHCLDRAGSVRYATEDAFLHHDALFQYCSRLAMGLAVLAARHMQAAVMQCVVWDGVANPSQAGTVVDMKTWRATRQPQHIVRCGHAPSNADLASFQPLPGVASGRETRAMLFGDLHGFSKLTDRELPRFAQHIMCPIADVVQSFRSRMSFVNTWGDGIFCVFEDVRDAARWALTLQARLAEIDLADAGLPTTLQLRLGGHLGPVYQLMDPILNRINFYGTHVSRAARIEPVTPEGCVYVTETFAAILALADAEHFACDYAGYTEMAKHYGRLRIFLLRATQGETSPVVLGDIERPPLEPVQTQVQTQVALSPAAQVADPGSPLPLPASETIWETRSYSLIQLPERSR